MSQLKQSQELKGLESQLKIVQGRLSAKKVEQRQVQQEVAEMQKTERGLIEKIRSFDSKNLKVTEHAILRYLERVQGIDLKSIEDKILTEDLQKMTNTLGKNGKFPIENFTVVMKEGSIVTVET